MRWLVFIALAGILLWWAWSLEQNAETRARAFCDSVEAGQPFEQVRMRAEAAGDNRLRRVDDRSVLVVYKGVTAFSRHGCEVTAEEGKVAGARYLKVD